MSSNAINTLIQPQAAPDVAAGKPLVPPTYAAKITYSDVLQEKFCRSTATSTTSAENPFDSPDSSFVTYSEIESGNTSGRDEFHLERYGESSLKGLRDRVTEHSQPSRRPPKKPRDGSVRKKAKPGLNIITDFSRPIGHAFTDDVALNHVEAKRAEVGQRPMLSAKSQKVEHFRADARVENPNPTGFVNINDLLSLRKERYDGLCPRNDGRRKIGKLLKQRTDKSESGFDTTDKDSKQQANSRIDGDLIGLQSSIRRTHSRPRNKTSTSADRSIAIGMVVPKFEAELHPTLSETNSATTTCMPLTPSILVASAEPTSTWQSPTNFDEGPRRRRPASSIYSQATPHENSVSTDTDTPPVPLLPKEYQSKGGYSWDDSPRNSIDSPEPGSTQQPRGDIVKVPLQGKDRRGKTRPRASSTESQRAILPRPNDTVRPQSKGWWNLMLSPMLSRAGTITSKKSLLIKEHVPPVPGIPFKKASPSEDLNKGLENSGSLGNSAKGGLNILRLNSWSLLDGWEKDREKAAKQTPIQKEIENGKSKGHRSQESTGTTLFFSEPGLAVEGLATEYYHACAVDLISSTPYFECQNHSCAERLPKLASSRGDGVLTGPDLQPLASQDKLMAHERTVLGMSGQPLVCASDVTTIDDDVNKRNPCHIDARVVSESGGEEISKGSAASQGGLNVGERPSVACSRTVAEPEDHFHPNLPEYSVPRAVSRSTKQLADVSRESRRGPISPGPISPEMRRVMISQGAIPMADVHPAPAPIQFINHNTVCPGLPDRKAVVAVSLADIERLDQTRDKIEAKRRILEEDAVSKEAGGLRRGRACFPKRGCTGRGRREGRTRRRWYVTITTALLSIIITAVVLATQLTREGDATPIDSQWLNLTGFPPMPTGITTIVRPDPSREITACVNPVTLWSCAVPKENQASISPNDPDEPNFRIEIRFRNGTVPANYTMSTSYSKVSKWRRFVKRSWLQSRQNDPFTNELFESNPAPPSLADQNFLGNTTDNITFPFDGEATPFFMTFLPTSPVLPPAFSSTPTNSRLRTRQSSNSTIKNPSLNIPPPALNTNGTAAPANVLPNNPYPISQPVRLYNRGQDTEHYGFYTYYDKAIFLTSTLPLNGGETPPPEDENGGASMGQAKNRCTFSQTRFLVQIWTNPAFGRVVSNRGSTSGLIGNEAGIKATGVGPNGTTSATDFAPPGSFPYPITITLDRHGGDPKTKAAFCYRLTSDGSGSIVETDGLDEDGNPSPFLIVEERGAGGPGLINPVPSIIDTPGNGAGFNPNAGGVDGGVGGCLCQWTNFVGNG